MQIAERISARIPPAPIRLEILTDIFRKKSTPKVRTAAITWLSVTADRNRPIARQAAPNSVYPRIDV